LITTTTTTTAAASIYSIHSTAFFQDKLGKLAPERQNHCRF